MNKNKKTLMIIAGIIALIAIVIAIMVSCGDNKGEAETTTAETTVEATTAEATAEDMTIADENETPGDLEIPETDENGEVVTEKETKKKKEDKDKETTNYWDTVEVIEDVNETETVTDENGETITEEYPGQHSGWSPIVKPEDLE